MNKPIKIILIVFLVGLLVLIRMFEDQLFYGVLLEFFKTTHSTDPLPSYDLWKLLGSISLRYGMNTLLSLGILWVLFEKRSIVRLSAILYGVLYIVAMILFLLLISLETSGGHLMLFYVRRFLIQPIFLLILVPAFYFQNRT
ncbi:exosortase F system-associated protein [Altibacter sp.]|uniref:exosortase F system-associated membrane protein n=1 Tax=Altibacter sp. TaxID=2024823 RepID=UPI000C910AC6|nr:exosortase F system-associated protein [Altibacter sp.]MAP53547.1 exosortase F system-associated protein [Altibacter sp.]